MRRTHVLVSGAGVAGATAAYWLHRHGMEVTVVERAPAPRPGGQAVDVRGPACEVAARTGVLDDLRAARTAMRGVSFVDDEGAETYSSTASSLTGGPTDGPDVEILRDDLTAILLGAVPDDVEIVFGDRVTGLVQDPDGVDVSFARGAPRRFDVVLGADGAHSGVRALTFGPDEEFVHELGSHVAVFGAPNEFGLDRWQTFRQTPGTPPSRIAVRSSRRISTSRPAVGPPVRLDAVLEYTTAPAAETKETPR
ncbi:MAG: FAD-dependent oxidoreductase, partial [Pseudonocardia sediminis]